MSMDNERAPARTVILASLLCLAIFGGCGQKGPLYLPDDGTGEEVAAETGTAQDVADTIEQEEEDRKVLDAQ
jgi:predicted small lipoprotein YifL